VFTAEQLRRFLEGNPPAMFSVAQGLCERLADAEARIASAARDNADRRLVPAGGSIAGFRSRCLLEC
jgi:hypothetical protein